MIVEFPGHTNLFFKRNSSSTEFSKQKELRDLSDNNCLFSS